MHCPILLLLIDFILFLLYLLRNLNFSTYYIRKLVTNINKMLLDTAIAVSKIKFVSASNSMQIRFLVSVFKKSLDQEDEYLLNTATESLRSKENTENGSFRFSISIPGVPTGIWGTDKPTTFGFS